MTNKTHVIVYNKRRAIYLTQNYFHVLFQGKPRGKGSIIPCLGMLPPLFKELGQVLCEPLRTLTPPLFMRILSAQVTHVEMSRHIIHRACALRRNINKLKASTGCVSFAALYSFFVQKKWLMTHFFSFRSSLPLLILPILTKTSKNKTRTKNSEHKRVLNISLFRLAYNRIFLLIRVCVTYQYPSV